MHERTVRELNEIVKDEQRMIEAYAYMIEDTQEPELKEELRRIQERHFQQLMAFSDRIYELGGDAKFKVGASGLDEDRRHYQDKRRDITDLERARKALTREQQQTERLSRFVLSDEDPSSLELIKLAANKNQHHIKALEEYIQRRERQ
jgi:uncharacterized membrane protein YccC